MLNHRPAQTESSHNPLDPALSDYEIHLRAVHSASHAGRIHKRDWIVTIGAFSVALLVVALYASICFHWGGPRVTLLLISLVATVWLYSVQRPWQSKS